VTDRDAPPTIMARRVRAAGVLAVVSALVSIAGCESTTSSITKKIDYKSAQTAPALELPPELIAPQYDDRFAVTTASGLAAQGNRPKGPEAIAPNANAEARVVRSGTERWLVVKTTPEIAWNTSRQFWTSIGFVLAIEQPQVGVMETDWAENRADLPNTFLQQTIGKYIDVFGNTYKRDKFRTRIERGNEPGTVEIYISHRGTEQVPTVLIDNKPNAPSGFVWAVMPPDPGLEAEMLTRLMIKFGTPAPEAAASVQAASAPAPAAEKARLESMPNGGKQLVVDDSFDRAWRRVGLALDRVGFTVVDRDRSKGTYFVRYSNPDTDTKKEKSFWEKLQFWKDDVDKPEQYRITVAQADPRSLVTVQDPDGAPDKSANGEKILALLKDQLK
jgi:outer membrane protein assembly factor BamC